MDRQFPPIKKERSNHLPRPHLGNTGARKWEPPGQCNKPFHILFLGNINNIITTILNWKECQHWPTQMIWQSLRWILNPLLRSKRQQTESTKGHWNWCHSSHLPRWKPCTWIISPLFPSRCHPMSVIPRSNQIKYQRITLDEWLTFKL